MVGLRSQQVMRLGVKITERNHRFARALELRNRFTDLQGLASGGPGKIFEIQYQRSDPVIDRGPADRPHHIV